MMTTNASMRIRPASWWRRRGTVVGRLCQLSSVTSMRPLLLLLLLLLLLPNSSAVAWIPPPPPLLERIASSSSSSSRGGGQSGGRTSIAAKNSASFFGSWFQFGGPPEEDPQSNYSSSGSDGDNHQNNRKSKGVGSPSPQQQPQQSQSSSSLGGVVGVMEQMDNLKASQRLGGATSGLLQELSNLSIEGSSSDGRIKVWLDGQQRPLRVELDDSCLSGSDSTYEVASACLEAMQQAHSRSVERMDDKLKNFYKDLGLS